MSHSLYNPFMPSRHLNPRASGLIVFGGGGEEGYAEGGNVGDAYRDTINRDRANDLSVKKQTLREANELLADEKAQRAKAVADGTPDNADGEAAAQRKVDSANKAVTTASGDLGIRMQNQITKKSISALTDPESIIKKASVATIDSDAAGTSIADTAGKAVGTAEQMAVPLSGSEEITRGGDRPPAAAQAGAPDALTANTYDATKTLTNSKRNLQDIDTLTGTVSKDSEAVAATQDPETTAVKDIEAAQGESVILNNDTKREILDGELVDPVANAEKASKYTEQIQAATATPSDKATVKGQLAELMQDFDGGETPAWASGALRAASSAMAARGLGSSSMAGQALVQAAMESALPIAMADAKTIASFEAQNLSNVQQRAMLAAEQRAAFIGQEFDQGFQAKVQRASKIGEVANMNFTADQQIALENSRTANTMELANLDSKSAMVMATAAAVSGLETQNLTNIQQAAVQKAQAFLGIDMANFDAAQQTELFKAQAVQQALLTDGAADNASKQFNASSKNQTDQFMENLGSQVDQFNATQKNALTTFREGETNAATKFNATLREQRVQFNASNALVVAQANALWRQNTETIDTAAQNSSNTQFAKETNGITNKVLDETYQRERDMMDMYFNSQEKMKDRITSLLIGDKDVEAANVAAQAGDNAAKANLLLNLFWPF